MVIAVINGYALGGGTELALACDIRIASENARLGLPEAGLGLMPGYGGTQLTARIIGTGRAKYMMFTGEMITASQAYEFGLVEKVFSKEKLMDEARELARQLDEVGSKSFLLVVVTGLSTGIVLSMQSRGTLTYFGAEAMLPDLVALSVIKESTKPVAFIAMRSSSMRTMYLTALSPFSTVLSSFHYLKIKISITSRKKTSQLLLLRIVLRVGW